MKALPVGHVIADRWRIVEIVRDGEASVRARGEAVEGGARVTVLQAAAPGGNADDVAALAAAWRDLRIDGVPRVLDVRLEGDDLVVVSEAVEAVTLYRHLEGRGQALDEAEVLTLAGGLCDVLERVHGAGVVCGALGPDSVGVGDHVWLLEMDPVLALRARMRKRSVDPRVDVYGLGRVLYFAGTRVAPSEAGRRVTEAEPLKPMHELNATVSLKTEMAVEGMLEVEPSRRPPDVATVRERLGLGAPAPPAPAAAAPDAEPPAPPLPDPPAVPSDAAPAAEGPATPMEPATADAPPTDASMPSGEASASHAPSAPPATATPAPSPAAATPAPPAEVSETPPPTSAAADVPAAPPPAAPPPPPPPPPVAVPPPPPLPTTSIAGAPAPLAPIPPPPLPPPPSVARRRGGHRRISHGPSTIVLLTLLLLGAAWIARLLYVVQDQVRVKVDPSPKPAPVRGRVRISSPRGTPLPATLTGGDGSVMMLVPEGEFPRGVPDPDVDSGPQISENLGAYYIDRTEVTAAQFARFVRATGWVARGPWRRYVNPERTDLPVVGVTAEDADEYARWLGKRLPTEEEWEKAARGVNGRTWPWGDTLPDRRMAPLFAATSDTGGASVPVGSCGQGASPYGVLDMAGNVWEWTSSSYVIYSGSRARSDLFGTGLRVVRGGSWNFPLEQAKTTVRMPMPPRLWAPDTGFRCVLPVSH